MDSSDLNDEQKLVHSLILAVSALTKREAMRDKIMVDLHAQGTRIADIARFGNVSKIKVWKVLIGHARKKVSRMTRRFRRGSRIDMNL